MATIGVASPRGFDFPNLPSMPQDSCTSRANSLVGADGKTTLAMQLIQMLTTLTASELAQ